MQQETIGTADKCRLMQMELQRAAALVHGCSLLIGTADRRRCTPHFASNGGKMARMRQWRRHTVEFKRQVVEQMKTCENIHELARQLKLQRKLLYTWKYQFEGRPEPHAGEQLPAVGGLSVSLGSLRLPRPSPGRDPHPAWDRTARWGCAVSRPADASRSRRTRQAAPSSVCPKKPGTRG